MKSCVFCKLASGELDSAKFWEDGEFFAVLDINPNVKGMALVISKKHYESYAFTMPDDVYSQFLLASKKVAKILDKKLQVKRTALVIEGMGIDHAHVKLYPLYGLKATFEEIFAKERAFFDKYEGYVSTVLGPPADFDELKKLAEELRE